MAYLKVSLAGFEVSFSKFLGDQIPRIDPKENSGEYSAAGTPSVMGINYEPPRLWTVNAICEQAKADDLYIIWMESNHRKNNQMDWRITVDDTTFPEFERTTRTRAIVPDTTETTITRSGLTYVKFFARYYGWIIKCSEYRQLGKDWGVTFTMQEQEIYPRAD